MNIRIELVPDDTIKYRFGMAKGKSDPIDSRRIREYGERFADKLTFSPLTMNVLDKTVEVVPPISFQDVPTVLVQIVPLRREKE